MKVTLGSLLITLISLVSYGQTRNYSVIGSSTAAAMGATTLDSGWVRRLTHYYQNLGLSVGEHNTAVGGRNCYQGMPSTYTPPSNRNYPINGENITYALPPYFNTDVVIVNYPTNGYDTFSVHEIMQCLQTMKDSANILGKACYITTSQPRQDGYFPDMAARTKLKVIADSIMNRFGNFAIDFFTPIADPVTYMIKSEYSYGDGIHVNNAGHKVLFKQVRDKDIFGIGHVNRAMTSGNWENPAIWENEEIPTISDSVVVLGTKTVTLNSSATVKALNVASSATLTVASGQALKIAH